MKQIDEKIEDQMIELWAIPADEYDRNATFAELGADDLDITALLIQLETVISVDSLADMKLSIENTPNDLITAVKQQAELL